MNIFESLNKIDDVKSLRESFTDGKYCIVAITNDGKRKFYKDGKFIDDCKNCTVFTDLDEARDVWHEIDKSGFRRVFVPNWSEDMFCESINEELSKSIKSLMQDIVEMEFETGHIVAEDFDEFKRCMMDEGIVATEEMYDYYCELQNSGPNGFEQNEVSLTEAKNEVPGQISIFDDMPEEETERRIELFEIVPEKRGTSTERHVFNSIAEAKKYVLDNRLSVDDISKCEGCTVEELFSNN